MNSEITAEMSSDYTSLKKMLKSFRKKELFDLLQPFDDHKKCKTKQALVEVALELLKNNNPFLKWKIRYLHKNMMLNSKKTASQSSSLSSSQHNKKGNKQLRQAENQPENGSDAVVVNTSPVLQLDNQPRLQRLMNFNIKFKKLFFYKKMSKIVPPLFLETLTDRPAMQECSFLLTPQQTQQLDLHSQEEFQVHVRFCLFQSNSEQVEFIPLAVHSMYVNGLFCTIPAVKFQEGSVDITPLVIISSEVSNSLTFQNSPTFSRENRTYAWGVFLLKKRSVDEQLKYLKKNCIQKLDVSRRIIKGILNNPDSETSITMLRVPLTCPLSRTRLTYPCRANTCSHLQCFDANIFLKMYENKSPWVCPICNKNITGDNLIIDGYFQNILTSHHLPPDASEVELCTDGSWSAVNNRNSPNPVTGKELNKAKEENMAIIFLDSSDDELSSMTKTAETRPSVVCSNQSKSSDANKLNDVCPNSSASYKLVLLENALTATDQQQQPSIVRYNHSKSFEANELTDVCLSPATYKLTLLENVSTAIDHQQPFTVRPNQLELFEKNELNGVRLNSVTYKLTWQENVPTATYQQEPSIMHSNQPVSCETNKLEIVCLDLSDDESSFLKKN